MKTTIFQGFRIHIENEVGSTRSGMDSNGKPWQVTMKNAYGEIVGTNGADGDPVDVFLGTNPHAKFVYIIHQTDKMAQGWDEDKVMLGFNDLMDAKDAYFKNYDEPEHFYGSVSTLTVDEFKKRLKLHKSGMIHASKAETSIQLYANRSTVNPFKIGDPVTVDGFHGRGIVIGVKGRRVTVRFRSLEFISRDFIFVHKMSENTVSKMWKD